MSAWDTIVSVLPQVLIATAGMVILMIFIKIYQGSVARKVRRMGGAAGISFGDIDAMRKKGLISEEEHRRIRQATAQRELARTREEERIQRERALLLQAQTDPEAVRRLLDNPPAPPAAPSVAKPPEPAPGAGELDQLLARGAISQEEYDRLIRLIRH